LTKLSERVLPKISECTLNERLGYNIISILKVSVNQLQGKTIINALLV
jgi:hypothetical protein